MKYNFDITPDRRGSDSLKWNFFDPDVIPMWMADMDFPSPEPVIHALHERVDHGVFGYPRVPEELINLTIQRLEEHYQWIVNPQELDFFLGVVIGLNVTCQMVKEPNAGVLTHTPVYHPILAANIKTGLLGQQNELVHQSDGSYKIDFDAFEAAITPDTKLFILCNPHNPVGKAFTHYELERLAEICLRHNLIICSDEIHHDFIYSGNKHTPIASLDQEIAKITITLLAPHKTYNIAGLNCAIAIIQDPELMKRFQTVRKSLVYGVNVMGLAATVAAYREGQEWLEQLLIYLEGNRDYLYNRIHEDFPGVKMWKPEATYLAWLDFRTIGLDREPCDFFIKEAKVGMSDGLGFGKQGKGFTRLNFGCSRELLKEALDRMKVAMPR